MPDSAALWRSVDAITQPTRQRVTRAADADWLWELENDPTISYCDVAAYRAATLAYGEIPALWDQAEWALTTGSEMQEGGASLLRERSPADLDLMETMLTIRESMCWQLPGRGVVPRDGIKAHMRQLASHVVKHEPQHVEWWTFRFEQWARMLRTHLNALDHTAKPVHLRNTACPQCATRQVTIPDQKTGERKVFPAIKIDFVDGTIRAAWCQACGHAWFRGDQLGELANLTDPQGMTA